VINFVFGFPLPLKILIKLSLVNNWKFDSFLSEIYTIHYLGRSHMNLIARRSLSKLKFFALVAVLASASIGFLVLLYYSETIDLMTLACVSIVIVLAMIFVTAVYTYFEVKRKTSGFLRF